MTGSHPNNQASSVRNFLELFLPAVIKNDKTADLLNHDAFYDKSLLIVAVILISVFAVIIGNAYFYSIAPPDHLQLVLVNAALSVSCLLLLLATSRLWAKTDKFYANGYALAVLISLIGNIYLSGFSWDSPYIPLLIFIPVWAFLLCSPRAAVIFCLILSAFFVVIYFFSATSNFQAPQIFTSDDLNQTKLSVWIATLTLVAITIFTFQKNYVELSKQLSVERSHFAFEADHDGLTGLANRNLFYRRAAHALNITFEEHLMAGIIYIDLDGFKAINDNFGHQAGDAVLIQKAKSLKAAVRSSDTVARLGGDEFGVVLHAIAPNQSEMVIEKIRKAMNIPVEFEGKIFEVGCSIGVSLAQDNGKNIDDLIKHADEQMYLQKKQRAKKK
jgi:diguanylate cyclase (GGDEF)-like protein